MVEHITNEEIEKYLFDEIENTDYVWFESAMEHIMSCDNCQARLSIRMDIENICEPENMMLGDGLKKLASDKKILPFRPKVAPATCRDLDNRIPISTEANIPIMPVSLEEEEPEKPTLLEKIFSFFRRFKKRK